MYVHMHTGTHTHETIEISVAHTIHLKIKIYGYVIILKYTFKYICKIRLNMLIYTVLSPCYN